MIEKLLAAALREREVLDYLREALTNDLVVSNPFYLQVARFVSGFLDDRGVLPKEGDFEVWISTLSEAQQRGVVHALGELRSEDLSGYTTSYLAEESLPALKQVAARNALYRLNQLGDNVDPETLHVLADQVHNIEPLTIKGLGLLRDYATWLPQLPVEDQWSTGVERLDRYIGGFRKELVFVLADSGLGKTTSLINFGFAAARQGANVLHITMELSVRNTLHRYYRRIAEAERAEFAQSESHVADRVRRFLRFAKGGVATLFVEPYVLDPDKLRRLLRLYTRTHGAIDLLILDYLDLMEDPRSLRNRYEKLGMVSHAVRGMCTNEFGCTALSATQATRESHGRERLTLKHMGDSYEKVRAADLVIALVQTEEEQVAHQARFQLLKVRESPGRGQETPLYYNMDVMMIADLDSPNTKRVMARFGHRPLVTEGEEEDAEG